MSIKKFLCFSMLLFIAFSCEESNFEEIKLETFQDNNLTFDVNGTAKYTNASELVLQLETESEKVNLIFKEADFNSYLNDLESENLKFLDNGRIVILENLNTKRISAVGLRGDKITIEESYENRDQFLKEFSSDKTLIKLDDYIEVQSIHTKTGNLNLPESFEDKYESVYDYLSPESKKRNNALAPNCVDGGCGVQQCGGQFISILGAAEVSPVVCSNGYFCCTPYNGATPICFPCYECTTSNPSFDPCTGTLNGGGSGGGSSTPGSDSCLYVIEVVYYDVNGNVIATEIYVVWGQC